LAAHNTLRESIEEFLREQVLRKAPEERNKRDEQLLEYGRAFADVLYRHEKLDTSEPAPHEQAVTRLVRSANEINREYDLRNLDAEAIAEFRKGR
jgi:hypothetical protein